MRKVVRNIISTIADVSMVVIDGDKVGFETIGTITVSGSATKDKILKEARKAFKVDPEIQLVVTNTTETETRFEMDEETFLKYATLVERKGREPELSSFDN